MDEEGWKIVGRKKRKDSCTLNTISSFNLESVTEINFNSNRNPECVKIKKAKVSIWFNYSMSLSSKGVQETLNDRFQELNLFPVGNVKNIWDCLQDRLEQEKFFSVTEFKEFREGSKAKKESVESMLHNISNRLKIEIVFYSLFQDIQLIKYGNKIRASLYFVHIRFDLFLAVERKEEKLLTRSQMQYISKIFQNNGSTSLHKNTSKDPLKKLRDVRKKLRGKQQSPLDLWTDKMKEYKYKRYAESINSNENIFKCKISFKNAHYGIARPLEFDEILQGREIELLNRQNCGYNVFEGDHVLVRINDKKNLTGSVVKVLESIHEPVNEVYLCKVCRDQASLMKPLNKFIPKIRVDNVPAYNKYKEEIIQSNLSNEQKSAGQKARENSRFADNKYLTVYQLDVGNTEVKFNKPTVEQVDPENSSHLLFIVVYSYWSPIFMYPSGYVVGIIDTRDIMNMNNILKVQDLISSICHVGPYKEISDSDILVIKEKIQKDEINSLTDGEDSVPKGAVIFTIDDETTIDMDDAISYHFDNEKQQSIIGVHITDITRYISRTSKLYERAEEQCVTHYFINSKVEPLHMLSKKMAGLLSLKKNEVCRVISVLFPFDLKNDELCQNEICIKLGHIKSQYKLNYEQVEDMLYEMNDGDEDELKLALKNCYRITKKLRIARAKDSFYVGNFENLPRYLTLNFDDAFFSHILVEEMMLLANKTVAEKIFKNTSKGSLLRSQEPVAGFERWVDRVYQETNMDFHSSIKECMNQLRINRSNENNKKPLRVSNMFYGILQQLVMEGKFREAKHFLRFDELYNEFYFYKSEWYQINFPSKYRCSVEKLEQNRHFSLGYNLYTHFTSPIRRFCDVIVHFLLKNALNETEPDFSSEEIDALCSNMNRSNTKNKMWEKYILPYTVNFSCILDCFCGEITKDSIVIKHPILSKVVCNNKIKFPTLRLEALSLSNEDDSTNINWCQLHWKKIILSCCDNFENQETSCKEFNIPHNIYDAELNEKAVKTFKRLRRSMNLLSMDEELKEILKYFHTFDKSSISTRISSNSKKLADSLIDIKWKINLKNTIKVQIHEHISNGLKKIIPELMIIGPTFQICLIHHEDPIAYFIPGGNVVLKHSDIIQKFKNISEYKEYFLPLIRIEALQETLSEPSVFTLLDVTIQFLEVKNEDWGIMHLTNDFCRKYDINFSLDSDDLTDRWEYSIKKSFHVMSGDLICLRAKPSEWNNYWVGHGEILSVSTHKFELGNVYKKIIFRLTSSNIDFRNLPRKVLYIVDFYERPITMKRQMDVIFNINDNLWLKKVVLAEDDDRKTDGANLKIDISKYDLNKSQHCAVNKALNNKLSLIWGPPGTGKTRIGCILSKIFVDINKKNGVIMYCGPSNDSIDLVVVEMKKKFGESCPKMLRIYGEVQELADFPLPGRTSKTRSKLVPELQEFSLHFLVRNFNESLKEFDSTFDAIIRDHNLFNENIRNIVHEKIQVYKETLRRAKLELIKNEKFEMVLCTTAVAATSIMNEFKIRQVIIDEAGMCTEPETLIPLWMAKRSLRNAVLIGDHKQLRPIIQNNLANSRGLQISMFERYQSIRQDLVTMLNLQYRMHPSICEFPSCEFYSGKLRVALSQLWSGLSAYDMKSNRYDNWNGIDYKMVKNYFRSVLSTTQYSAVPNECWVGQRPCNIPYKCFRSNWMGNYPERILFIHIVGKEIEQLIKTASGSECSKANMEELNAVIYVYKQILKNINPPRQGPNHIAVITQYKLQETKLRENLNIMLQEKGLRIPCNVKTVIRSQGSESDYVIFSTVRSIMNKEDIMNSPTFGWEKQYLGFITDPNKVNVALTRAKKGLIIIGNKHLLRVNKIWKSLIENLEKRNCVINNILQFQC